MATISIAREARVVWGASSLGFTPIGDKAYLLPVIHVISTVEPLGALVWNLQKILERWHRAVVQVGRSQPQAIKGHGQVARRFDKGVELPIMPLAVGVIRLSPLRRPHVEPMAVGTHLIERDDRPRPLLAEGMARGTVPVENRLPLRGSLLIYGKRILRGLNSHEVLLYPPQAGPILP